jgi:hypothetical protein
VDFAHRGCHFGFRASFRFPVMPLPALLYLPFSRWSCSAVVRATIVIAGSALPICSLAFSLLSANRAALNEAEQITHIRARGRSSRETSSILSTQQVGCRYLYSRVES